MLLGYYEPIINTIRDLTHFNNIASNLLILIPFGIGVVIGIIGIAKIIEWLLKRYEIPTYFGIIGFVLASTISILVSMGMPSDLFQLGLGIILTIVGFGIAYKLGEK